MAVELLEIGRLGIEANVAEGVATGELPPAVIVGEGTVPGPPMACRRLNSRGNKLRCGFCSCGIGEVGSKMLLTVRGTTSSSTDREERPLNVTRAFSAVQLRLRLENIDRRRDESKGMLKLLSALFSKRGIAAPTVALFAVPSMFVVVHPESDLVPQVRPVNPLIHTQLHDLSAFGTATPPFWHLIIPSQTPGWLGMVGTLGGGSLLLSPVVFGALALLLFASRILGMTIRTIGIMTAAATKNNRTIRRVTNVHMGIPQHLRLRRCAFSSSLFELLG
jgi:hypothetical protein